MVFEKISKWAYKSYVSISKTITSQLWKDDPICLMSWRLEYHRRNDRAEHFLWRDLLGWLTVSNTLGLTGVRNYLTLLQLK